MVDDITQVFKMADVYITPGAGKLVTGSLERVSGRTSPADLPCEFEIRVASTKRHTFACLGVYAGLSDQLCQSANSKT